VRDLLPNGQAVLSLKPFKSGSMPNEQFGL